MARIKSNKAIEKLQKEIETLSKRLNDAREELNVLKDDDFTALSDSGIGGNELLHNALTESEGRFKALAENIPDMIVRFDSNLRLLYGNPAVLKRTGLSLESLIGKTAIEYGAQPEAANNWENAARHVFNTGETVRMELTNYWQGEEKIFDIILVPEKNSSGKSCSIISIARDITEMKKVEESLQENERKLRSVLNATLESVYMFDRDGKVCMSNTTGLERVNKKHESEVIGCHFSEFMSPEVARVRQEKFDEVFNNGYPLEFEDERAGKTYHHNFFPVFRGKEVIYVVSYSTDITSRKKAEIKLVESEDRFRTIAESLTVMISITRISDSMLTFVNEPFEVGFGYMKDELIGKKLPDRIFPKADLQNIRNILSESDSINNREIKVNRSDGSSFWIMLTIKKINFQNEPSYLSASIDITSSKRAQLELIRLNRVLDAHSKSSQAMMHADNEFNYISRICKIIIEDCGHSMVWIGYAQNDSEKSVRPVAYYGFDKGYIDQLNISWADNIQGRGPTGTAIRTGEKYICRNMRTDPSFIPWREAALERGYASSIVLPLRSEDKTFGAISIYSKEPDPFSETEINFLSELADDLAYGISFLRLAESERAAARAIKENEIKLKELIITKDKFFNIVAHDLKNPFTSLLGSSELLYENINDMSAENVRDLALILNASAKGGYAILQNLLDWSRSQTGQLKFSPKNSNLREIIDENIDSLQLQIINKGVNIRSELNHDLFMNIDKNMVNTVLRNLLSNSVKYTYKGGQITIAVTSDTEKVTIMVKDTGTGISEDQIENLFKLDNSLSNPGTENEQGTGLGLKLCKEFTEMMGGSISVKSKLNAGSEFKFTLPVLDEET
jgi:PAS domain S-box-containing protein